MRALPNLSGLSLREAAPTGVIPSVDADDVVHANLMYQQIRDVHIWEEEAWKRLQAYAISVGLGKEYERVTRPAGAVGIADAIVQRSLRAGIFTPTTNVWTELYSLLTNGFTTELVPRAYLDDLRIKPLKTTNVRSIKIPLPRDWHAYYVKEFEKQLPKDVEDLKRIRDEYEMQMAEHEKTRPVGKRYQLDPDSDSEGGFDDVIRYATGPPSITALEEWRRNEPRYPMALRWCEDQFPWGEEEEDKERIINVLHARLSTFVATVVEWPEWKDYQGKPSGPEPRDQLLSSGSQKARIDYGQTDVLERLKNPFTTKQFVSDKSSPAEPVGPWMYKLFTACDEQRAALRNNAERYNNFLTWILRAEPAAIKPEEGLLVEAIPFDLHPLELLQMSWDQENMPEENGYDPPEEYIRGYDDEMVENKEILSYFETVPTLKHRNCGLDFDHWWEVPRDVDNFFRMYTSRILRADRGAMAKLVQAAKLAKVKKQFKDALNDPDALEANIVVQFDELEEIAERNSRAHRREFSYMYEEGDSDDSHSD